MAQLRAVLAHYGEHEEVPAHEILARLARWAEAFTAARDQLVRASNDRPEAGAARHHAAELLEANDLEGAQTVLAQARQSLRESRQQTVREEAAILADEARMHRLRLDQRQRGQPARPIAVVASAAGPVRRSSASANGWPPRTPRTSLEGQRHQQPKGVEKAIALFRADSGPR